MTGGDRSHAALVQAFEEALRLVRDHGQPASPPAAGLPADPLPSLLEQCRGLLAAAPEPQPLRAIYHLACTGGTLIGRCLSTLPNVTLLSEIDPLSNIQIAQAAANPQFRPSDLIYGARVSLREPSADTVQAMFTGGLRALHDGLTRQGGYLCVRAHSHSQFCTGDDPQARPSVHEMLLQVAPVRAVVTVRHPLDSYLSLTANNWRHFRPQTLSEYARRYAMFLDAHAGLALFRYEDFTAAPQGTIGQICTHLGLPEASGLEDLLPVVRVSGDSGRHSRRIETRPRRAVPPEIAVEAAESRDYAALCDRLGYNAGVDAAPNGGPEEEEG